jgi:hypothetical protein
MNIKISILILMPFLLIQKESKCQTRQEPKKMPAKLQNINAERAFEILKIDSIENVYVIYAKRNDSTVKIVSERDGLHNCNPIVKGGFYDLQISSLLPMRFPQKRDLGGTRYNSTMIYLEDTGGVIWDLFESDNLNGLCFIMTGNITR